MEEYFAEVLKEEVRSVTIVPRASPWNTSRSKKPRSTRDRSADHRPWSLGPRLLMVISLPQEDIRHGGSTGRKIRKKGQEDN